MMDEARFWQLVALAERSADERHLHRIWLELRQLEADTVLSFIDRLAEVLHRLDLKVVAKQPWRDVSEPWWFPRIPVISADGFLYARCAAVLEGEDTVDRILADPRTFKRRWNIEAERLLYVGTEVWESITKQPFDYSRESPYDYETASNPAGGWN